MKPHRPAAAVLIALCAPVACSDESTVQVDRNAVLRDLTANVLLPTCRDLGTRVDGLALSLVSLCEAPGAERLAAARTAWREARTVWQHAQVFQAGPFETLRMRSALDWYPVDPAGVEATIAGADPLTEDAVGTLGANRRGLPGVEVVLFDAARDAEAVVASLREGSGPSRRCQYLVAASAHAARATRGFVAAWEPEGGAYGRALATAGDGPAFASSRAAIDLVINQLINSLDALHVSRLSVPNGSRHGGVAQPDLVASIPSGRSVADLSDALEGARELYTGARGERRGLGLSAIVAARDPTLDRLVRAQFDLAARTLAAITVPLERAVVEQRPQVELAVAEVGRLKRYIRVDVSNVAGATVSFTDNDGD